MKKIWIGCLYAFLLGGSYLYLSGNIGHNEKYKQYVEDWVKTAGTVDNYMKMIGEYDNWKASGKSIDAYITELSKKN